MKFLVIIAYYLLNKKIFIINYTLMRNMFYFAYCLGCMLCRIMLRHGKLTFFINFILYEWHFCLCVCTCTMCMPSICISGRSVSDPLEAESGMVVNNQLCAARQTQALWLSSRFNNWAICPTWCAELYCGETEVVSTFWHKIKYSKADVWWAKAKNYLKGINQLWSQIKIS